MPHSTSPSPLPLAGRVILIVGAALAARLGPGLVALGATLAASDPDPKELGRAALPLNALPMPADPDSLEDCAAVIAEVIDSLDRLDGIVGASGAFVTAAAKARVPALPGDAAAIGRALA